MVEATFIASGNNMKEALDFSATLTSKLLFEDTGFTQAGKLDIFCITNEDANVLDKILWEKPKYAIISHNLVNNSSNDLVEIGYPGTKFAIGSDSIINLSPDLPNNLETYKNYFQLVIMDNGDLRERAAMTWTKCKNMGLKASFIESI